MLDQITDPHNVGAIFRSAAAFAATAIVTTQRHSPEATGALAKAASGALEHVPLVSVQNLARGLAALKDSGFLVVGLDSSGDTDLAALPLRAPLALVLGAEGKGLRQLTKETCDHVARIDLPGEIKSLNVSNAAALGLYVASRRLMAGSKNANGGPPPAARVPRTLQKYLFRARVGLRPLPLAEQPDAHAVGPENGDLGIGFDDALLVVVAACALCCVPRSSTMPACGASAPARPRRRDAARSRAADRRPRAGSRPRPADRARSSWC